MLNAQLLCTLMLNQISETVLGEVEKDSFIALPAKEDVYIGLLPPKPMCPNIGGLDEEFYSNGSRVGLVTRLDLCAESQL